MHQDLILEELQELKDKDLYRSLRHLTPLSGNTYSRDGGKVLLFCSNDYLGLSRDPRVIDASKEALGRYGAGAGAARLISGSLDVHGRLEEEIASLKKKERALLFSAGYLANLGVLSALAGKGDLIVLDKLCHASLIDGARLSGAELRVFPHKNYAKCEEIIAQAKGPGRRLIVTDSVFSMDGDLADLQELARIKKKYECFLIVDDAHATGVLGEHGAGSYTDEGLEDLIDVVTGTLSKSLGCIGGFAAASGSIIEYLVNKARPFIFATALPPAVCAAALEAVHILKSDPLPRRKLWENLKNIESALGGRFGIQAPINFPIIPILVGAEKNAMDLSKELWKKGYLVPAIRYPTVSKGKARLRVTLNAMHTGEEIRRFCADLAASIKVKAPAESSEK